MRVVRWTATVCFPAFSSLEAAHSYSARHHAIVPFASLRYEDMKTCTQAETFNCYFNALQIPCASNTALLAFHVVTWWEDTILDLSGF